MFLTKCAACAAPLAHDAPRCVRCQVRYCKHPAAATLDDMHEAVTTLEEIERIARRVLGGAHPTTTGIEIALGKARAALRARETGGAREPVSSAN